MATIPSPEDTARKILDVLVSGLSLRGENSAPLGAVIHNPAAKAIDRRDFEDGLKHAVAQGWVEFDGQFVKLTNAGYAAA